MSWIKEWVESLSSERLELLKRQVSATYALLTVMEERQRGFALREWYPYWMIEDILCDVQESPEPNLSTADAEDLIEFYLEAKILQKNQGCEISVTNLGERLGKEIHIWAQEDDSMEGNSNLDLVVTMLLKHMSLNNVRGFLDAKPRRDPDVSSQ